MTQLFDEKLIFFDVDAKDKQEVVKYMAERFLEQGRIGDLDEYVKAVFDRENHFSTAVGFLVATPHAKTEHALFATVGVAKLRKPILWDEEDDEMAQLIFLLAIPTADKGDRHLQILAGLSRKLIHETFRESIFNASSEQEVVALIKDL